MRLMVIGIGDCGCRIARQFADLNTAARKKRRVNIVTCAYAVNNDQAVLREVTESGPDWLKPVLIRGSTEAEGSSEAGARIMRQEGERVMLTMRLGAFVDTDAFLLVAGAAGSLGSGGVPILAQLLKERRVDKPVYALITLPFDSELDDPRRIHNTAVCLKSIDKLVDAVILVDNGGVGSALDAAAKNRDKVNREIVQLFYDLLCAGEMVGSKFTGGKVLDAGDIVHTLFGWTAIGVGRAQLPSPVFLWRKTKEFEEKSSETRMAIQAMNEALMCLSVDCKPEDAGRALYLLSAPPQQANVDMLKVLGNRLRELAPNAEMRDGSFYGAKGCIQVTVVVSELIYVDRVKNFYDRAARLAQTDKGQTA